MRQVREMIGRPLLARSSFLTRSVVLFLDDALFLDDLLVSIDDGFIITLNMIFRSLLGLMFGLMLLSSGSTSMILLLKLIATC